MQIKNSVLLEVSRLIFLTSNMDSDELQKHIGESHQSAKENLMQSFLK